MWATRGIAFGRAARDKIEFHAAARAARIRAPLTSAATVIRRGQAH
jgi:hypothetical protein